MVSLREFIVSCWLLTILSTRASNGCDAANIFVRVLGVSSCVVGELVLGVGAPDERARSFNF